MRWKARNLPRRHRHKSKCWHQNRGFFNKIDVFLEELSGFERLISWWARCAPRDGATLKTQFVIMFEDRLLA